MMEEKGKVAINFATFDELVRVPGIGEKLANAIVSIRRSKGNITNINILQAITRRSFPRETLQHLDFSENLVLDTVEMNVEDLFEITGEIQNTSPFDWLTVDRYDGDMSFISEGDDVFKEEELEQISFLTDKVNDLPNVENHGTQAYGGARQKAGFRYEEIPTQTKTGNETSSENCY